MKERPILFSAPMVRAILNGSKTQTRRVVKPEFRVLHAIYPDASISTNRIFEKGDGRIHCPYGQPGDRLWVRETFTVSSCGTAVYRADARDQRGDRWHSIEPGDPNKEVLWKPSIFCKREHSRITLEVTGVRVERLQEIDWIDAKREGVRLEDCEIGPAPDFNIDYVGGYQRLWESINGTGSWDANPWVWVVEFKRIRP